MVGMLRVCVRSMLDPQQASTLVCWKVKYAAIRPGSKALYALRECYLAPQHCGVPRTQGADVLPRCRAGLSAQPQRGRECLATRVRSYAAGTVFPAGLGSTARTRRVGRSWGQAVSDEHGTTSARKLP